MAAMTPRIHTPPKVLVIYAHPEPQNSVANSVMLEQIRSLENVTVRDLYGIYPDFFIDVKAEHQLLTDHDVIVFQHPLYMYSCPSLLKEWIDRVLSKGFAFGDECALEGKYWRSVITTGGKKSAFSPSGYNKYPLEQILQPFELSASLCKMLWLEPLVLYWSRKVDDVERLQHAKAYIEWLRAPLMHADLQESTDGNDR
ncbi:glutathione-regulated potassium-efflux system ancillary protein KefG [Vibrio sp. ZSDZ34]|jgi:glutathione-regulated potassium-efflux system ancillary protein KefG|uniref:Glutathione-regulated potassium-efflux system ancillary protein KefG n=1 Tax=Vibrio gelatinilyticus TaxID=2893468 RepID=A0A9X1WIH8_9VIBR|nr:glutathione-regulated potassium-efflux system ancillary protein KefG [Vibrio gelatinilyticus]MCJ2378810.1 glutathione-regulated potassium-efflux system ancillary protein KefG [Vibrio gelatinilyticus]